MSEPYLPMTRPAKAEAPATILFIIKKLFNRIIEMIVERLNSLPSILKSDKSPKKPKSPQKQQKINFLKPPLNQSTNKKKSPLKISAEKRARFGSELQRDFITP